MIGRTISHYQIREQLGSGGMGVVYAGVDTLLHRPVALKFLAPELTRDEEAKARFVQEARAASALDHPNICTIHEIGQTDDGQLFIVMTHYGGETLKKKIERGPLPIRDALDFAGQIADGLARAHEAGIVHRDIKPANLVITDRGVVKILDFGLAKVRSAQLTRTGAVVGTAAYMSPEQVRGEHVDHRTDVWSVGVVLHEMLSGRRPFEADYEGALLYAVMNGEPPPLGATEDQVPLQLQALVARCLEKERDARYPAMSELQRDLDRLRGPRALSGRTSARVRSRTMIWSSAAAAILLLLIGGYWILNPSETIAFSERDWILITDFENETNEEVFDNSLDAALAVSIGQSRFVSVFPDQRILGALRRMRKDPSERISAAVGQEIAQREGLRVLLVPGISRIGDTYVLTASIRDAQTGEDFRSRIGRADGKDDVLPALDELTQQIRRDLGETLPAIRRQSVPVQKVTTASLDALQQYALGKDRLTHAGFEQAKFHFERALELDSAFTSARASLGMLHVELAQDPWRSGYDAELGRSLLAEAVARSDDLTEAERYSVLAFHATAVEGDYDEAIRFYQALIERYPNNFAAHNNLGQVFEELGRGREAAASFREAIRLNPDAVMTTHSLIMLYLFKMGRLDSAYVWSRRHAERNPENSFAHSLLGYTYLGLDSIDAARRSIERAVELNPQSGRDLFRLARVYWLEGRLADASDVVDRLLALSPDSWGQYWLYLLYVHRGDTEQARAQFDVFRRLSETWIDHYPEYGMSYIAHSLALVHAGSTEEGWREALRAIEVDSSPDVFLGIARVAAVLGRFSDALSWLENGFANGFTDYVWMKIHPDLEPLRDDPRFQEMLTVHLKR